MLAEDVGTYLAAQSSLGLTVRTTAGGNLYVVPLPESAPDAAVAIMEYAASAPLRAMSSDLAPPIAEQPRFQVLVRRTQNSFSTGRELMEEIYKNLDWLHSTGIGSTGSTRYLQVRAISSPYWMGQDGNGRHRWTCNFEALKERG